MNISVRVPLLNEASVKRMVWKMRCKGCYFYFRAIFVSDLTPCQTFLEC